MNLLNTNKLDPANCWPYEKGFGELRVIEHRLSKESKLKVVLENRAGQTATIEKSTNATLRSPTIKSVGQMANDQVVIPTNENKTIYFDFSDIKSKINSGDCYVADVIIQYNNSMTGLEKSQGRIRGRVGN